MPKRVVIVGASAAGLSAAEALRSRGFDGKLTLIGDEVHAPYDRPPLSKQILMGSWEPERVMLRDEAHLSKLAADLVLGRGAVGLDTADRQVLLTGGDRVDYDTLVIATGVTPRRLFPTDLDGVHVLRTLDDALALRAALLREPKVVVVGAGFLGAEVAAAARQMGLDVTVVDPLPLPMRRQFGDRIGELIGELHRDNGVALRLGIGVARFVDDAGRVVAVELSDDTVLDADVVVVAVGSTPATGWLADSGVPLGNGVETDEHCQAAPSIYAVGDVACWHNAHFGVRMRVEHRMNATEHGIAAAVNILGEARPFSPVPYFWTDQYDTKIQAYGYFPPNAQTHILRGSTDDHKFVAAYVHDDIIVGVLGWNNPREVRNLRKLVVERTPAKEVLTRPAWHGPVAY